MSKSDNTLLGATRQVRKRLKKLVQAGRITNPEQVRADLNEVLRDIRKINPDIEHAAAIDLMALRAKDLELSVMLKELNRQVQGNWRARPFSERTALTLGRIEQYATRDVKDTTAAAKIISDNNHVDDMKTLVQDLPPEHARPLLERIPDVRTGEQLVKWVQDARNVADTYVRDVTRKEILSLTKKKSLSRTSNANFGQAVDFIRRWMTPNVGEVSRAPDPSLPVADDAAVVTAVEGYEPGKKIKIPKGVEARDFLQRMALDAEAQLHDADVGVDTDVDRLAELHQRATRALRQIDGQRAELLFSEAPSGETVADLPEAKPVVTQREATGQVEVNRAEFRKRLEDMSSSDLRLMRQGLRRIIQQGKLASGLYQKILKWNADEDAQAAIDSIADRDTLSDRRKRAEAPIGLARTLADPVTTEGWLKQINGGREGGILRRVLFNAFERPYTNALQHEANSRKYARSVISRVYKLDANKPREYDKILKKMQEKLPNGIRRGEAIWAYALWKDGGRRHAIERDGIQARGKAFDLHESLDHLTPEDRLFAEKLQAFFNNNPFIEQAFENHRFLRGFEAERSPSGYFPSRRSIEPTRVARDVDDFGELTITKSTGALEARDPSIRSPFKLDGGALAAFYKVTSDMARYSEIALPMYRAERLMNNPAFRNEFINKFGRTRWEQTRDYLRNILGFVGHNPTTFDTMMTWIPHAWLTSKIAMNVTSAIRQTFSLMTALGDDILDSKAVIKAFNEGSGFDERVGRSMRELSGLAYMRLNVGRFAEALVVLGDRDPTSRLTNLQNRSFVLQKFADDWALRVTWRAAEIMADEQGLTGEARDRFVVDKFEGSLTRNQASNSPLYTSPLEVEAKENTLLRGSLALQRELNRLYNVVRRHVVTSVQNPSKQNIIKAANAVFWSGIANSTTSVGLNAIRAAAFGLPLWTVAELSQRALQDMFGRWYVLSDTVQFFLRFGGQGQQYASEQLLGPAGSMLLDIGKAGESIAAAVQAGSLDPGDPGKRFRSGARRGQDKVAVELASATDHALSASSGILGLPFWAVWYQAKGLYNWKKNDYRLLVHLETDFQRAKDSEDQIEINRLQRVKDRVNQVHRRREQGLLTDEAARGQIVRLLETRE